MLNFKPWWEQILIQSEEIKPIKSYPIFDKYNDLQYKKKGYLPKIQTKD